MRLANLLLVGFAGLALSCAAEDPAPRSDTDADEDTEETVSPVGGGGKKDGGTPKPGAGSGGSSDEDDDDAPSGSDDKSDNSCDKLDLLAKPKSPRILIVLDRSGSMILPPVERWTPSVNAVTKFTAELTETVKFGLMLFPAPGAANPATDWTQFVPGLGGAAGMNGGCTPGKINVPIELNSADEIAMTLANSRPDFGATPTSSTLDAALAILGAPVGPDSTNEPAFIVLVTDGQPTCGASGAMTSPEDIAATNAALDKLTEAKVKTYVVGFGIDAVGAPAMEQFAMHGGTEKFYPVENEQSLVAELTRIAGALVPCEYELKDPITKPEFIRVQIDGETYKYQEDWEVDGNKIVLRPDAAACNKLRDAKVHALKITKECDVVVVF
jgi:hypothetical protein